MPRLSATFCAWVLALLPLAGTAQVNPAFADLDAAVGDSRAVIQSERRMLVSQALQLEQAEAAGFWPVYDQYAAELKDIGNLRVKVITDYAAAYPNLSDEAASQLLKDGLKYQERMVKLRKNYLKKFTRELGPAKTARFYQLENKLDAIGNFALAREIPLFPGEGPAIAPPAGP